VRPGLSPDDAREQARLILALLVGSHEIGRGAPFGPSVVRGRIVRLLRSELAPVTIDSEAGVAVETIYRAFGSKAGLFRAVVEAAIAGGAARAEVPPEERPAIRAIREELDPRRQLELYAGTQPGIHRRAAPLRRALAAAAETDPELRALQEELETLRLNGLERFMGLLAERGALRRDLSVERPATSSGPCVPCPSTTCSWSSGVGHRTNTGIGSRMP
jgi:Bacterial regulatory proteins, tetR family